jgi:hypothetical protein
MSAVGVHLAFYSERLVLTLCPVDVSLPSGVESHWRLSVSVYYAVMRNTAILQDGDSVLHSS